MIKFIVFKKTFGVQTAKWVKDDVYSPFDNSENSEKEALGWAKDRADELEIQGYHVKIEKIQ